MARVQKDTVTYFPHDANACVGDTLTVLQSRFGNDGYAFWFKLLEKLASTDGHYLDCRNSTKWHLLLAKTGVNEITGVEIMRLLVEMNAIDKKLWDSKLIWCQNLVDNLSEVYRNRRREIPPMPIITSIKGITTPRNDITTPQSTQSKVEKVKDRKVIFDQFWVEYPRKVDKQGALKAFIKLKPDNGLFESIMLGLSKAKASNDWAKDDGQFIPHPTTWLNARRWEDEYGTARSNPNARPGSAEYGVDLPPGQVSELGGAGPSKGKD